LVSYFFFLQNVHHAGQPMPGEEQEDIVMTSTQMSILNVTCPLTGKPVIELMNPVRWYAYNSVLYSL
jgi:E3 SUMO-protein ligase NSE2